MSTTVLPDAERIDLTHTKGSTLSGRPPGRKRKRNFIVNLARDSFELL